MNMPTSYYDAELKQLAETYNVALDENVDGIKNAIAGASESSIIGVGSGGSFTIASLLCNLHETYTGRVSRPSTPLEIICNPSIASASPVFLISAEGKNPDIVEALQRTRMHSARAVHVITNRSNCPLIDCASQFTDIKTHVFTLAKKDGFLATNSLLLDAVLIARAYGELDKDKDQVPGTIDNLRLRNSTINEWLQEAESFISSVTKRGSVIVTFSPLLKPVAADLESKLSEAALLHCQLADLRSFAHGRHLWLADRPAECAILALIEPSLNNLWEGMRKELPQGIPTLTMPFAGSKPRDLLAGLVAQMHFVSAIAGNAGKDPGRPRVPQFGRNLHYIDLHGLVPSPKVEEAAEQSKYEVLGARWPSIERLGSMRHAMQSFTASIEQQEFRSIVFDYDGVLCGSRRKDTPPSEPIMSKLRQLIDGNIIVGIASGRGDSIQKHMRETLPESMWSKVHLGLYNGGYISDAGTSQPASRETSEFLSHVTRIMHRLKSLGAPIEKIRTTQPYQVSVRFREGVKVETNWFVIADALRQAGLDLSRVVRSKHSVDILAAGVNKAHLVAHIIQSCSVNPHQILTMGDQGAWPGNDCSLLDHRFSLSVDEPSRRLDRGWKLAPSHKRDVDATLWYLDRIHLTGKGTFNINLSATHEGLSA